MNKNIQILIYVIIMFFNIAQTQIQDWRTDFNFEFFHNNFNTAQSKLKTLEDRIDGTLDAIDGGNYEEICGTCDGEKLFLDIWKIRVLYASGKIDEAIQAKERLLNNNTGCNLTQRKMRNCKAKGCLHDNITYIEGLDFLSDKYLKRNYVDLWVVVNSNEVNYKDAGQTPYDSQDSQYISEITEKTDVFWDRNRVRFSLIPPRFESIKYFDNQVSDLSMQKEDKEEFIEYINLLSKLHRIEYLRDQYWDPDSLRINFSYKEKESKEEKKEEHHYLRFTDSIPSQFDNAGRFGLKIPHIPKLEDLFSNFYEGSEYYQFYTEDYPGQKKLKRYSFKTNKSKKASQFLFLSWGDNWQLVEQTEPDQIVFEIPVVFIDKKLKFYLSNLGEFINESDLNRRMSNIDKQSEIEEIDFDRAMNDKDFAKTLKAKGITIEKPKLADRKQITQWKINNCSDDDYIEDKEGFCKEYDSLIEGKNQEDLRIDAYILKINISEYKQFSAYGDKDEKIDLIIYEKEDKKSWRDNPLNMAILTFVLGLLLGI